MGIYPSLLCRNQKCLYLANAQHCHMIFIFFFWPFSAANSFLNFHMAIVNAAISAEWSFGFSFCTQKYHHCQYRHPDWGVLKVLKARSSSLSNFCTEWTRLHARGSCNIHSYHLVSPSASPLSSIFHNRYKCLLNLFFSPS